MSKNIKTQIKNKYLSRPFSADSFPRKTSSIWLDKNENLDPYLQKIIILDYNKMINYHLMF